MDTRERTAFHEAGHVVVAALAGVPIQGAAILCEPESAGKCYLASSDTGPIVLAMTYLAGAAAVRRADPTEPAVLGLVDSVCARELLRAPGDSAAVLEQVLALAEREVAVVVERCWPAIVRVAGELSARGYVSGNEVRNLCAPLRRGGVSDGTR